LVNSLLFLEEERLFDNDREAGRFAPLFTQLTKSTIAASGNGFLGGIFSFPV